MRGGLRGGDAEENEGRGGKRENRITEQGRGSTGIERQRLREDLTGFIDERVWMDANDFFF